MTSEDPRERVHRLFEAYAGAPLPGWKEFAAAMQIRPVNQGEVFLKETDEIGSYLYLVVSGVFHVRVFSADGSSRTSNFARPGDFMASLPAIEQRPRAPLPPEAANSIVGKALEQVFQERYRLTALSHGSVIEIPLHEMHRQATRSVAWGRALATAYLI